MSDDRFRDAFRPRETDNARKQKGGSEEVNPNVPLYMAQTPWYLAGGGNASLEHQRKPQHNAKAAAGLEDWYKRGRTSSAATRFRKGACENCGAMSHKTRDCLERPRKRGAKWTGKDIQPDEVVGSIDHLDYNYDAKRDRWNGYDPSTHKTVVERFEAMEEERRRLREEALDKEASEVNAAKLIAKKEKSRVHDDDFDSSSSDDDDDDHDKYAEKANMVGQKMDSNKRITIRNLRIREDRAKYLYNLSTESAHYDPKTRSMREAPTSDLSLEQLKSGNDAFQRASNGPDDLKRMQMFAWQAEQRGDTLLHMQANPTDHELQFKQAQQKKERAAREAQSSILERYGGAEHLDAMPVELRTGQTEAYVEYSRSGDIVRGQAKPKPRSRYEEDVYENNHTSVWGSWYDMQRGVWGYQCCHSTLRRSYCTGEVGKAAAAQSNA